MSNIKETVKKLMGENLNNSYIPISKNSVPRAWRMWELVCTCVNFTGWILGGFLGLGIVFLILTVVGIPYIPRVAKYMKSFFSPFSYEIVPREDQASVIENIFSIPELILGFIMGVGLILIGLIEIFGFFFLIYPLGRRHILLAKKFLAPNHFDIVKRFED